MIADLVGAEAVDQRQPSGLVVGIEDVDQLQQFVRLQRRAAFQADRVLDAAEIFDMAVVELAGAVADPDHVARGRVPVAGGGIDPREGLLVAEQQRLVAGVEIGGAQFGMAFEIEAAGAHEIQRVRDAVGQFLVAARLRRILQEAEHPLTSPTPPLTLLLPYPLYSFPSTFFSSPSPTPPPIHPSLLHSPPLTPPSPRSLAQLSIIAFPTPLPNPTSAFQLPSPTPSSNSASPSPFLPSFTLLLTPFLFHPPVLLSLSSTTSPLFLYPPIFDRSPSRIFRTTRRAARALHVRDLATPPVVEPLFRI